MSIRIGNAQDIGSRERQEDYLASKAIGNIEIAVLADGMGGHEGGDQASLIATQAFIDFIQKQNQRYQQENGVPDLLLDAAYSANAQLTRLKQGASSNMGTTLVGLVVRQGHAWWISVGDSLLFLWRDGFLQKINAEHSHYHDLRQRVFLGEISSSQAVNDPERDSLSSALMGEQMKYVDVSRFGLDLREGDCLLLASDGLETLSPKQIESILHRLSEPQQIADALVRLVKQAGNPHQDNVSVLVVTQGASLPAKTSGAGGIKAKASGGKLRVPALSLLAGILLGSALGFLLGGGSSQQPGQTPQTAARQAVPPPSPRPEGETPPKGALSCPDRFTDFKVEICDKIDPGKWKKLGIQVACNQMISNAVEICAQAGTQNNNREALPGVQQVEDEISRLNEQIAKVRDAARQADEAAKAAENAWQRVQQATPMSKDVARSGADEAQGAAGRAEEAAKEVKAAAETAYRVSSEIKAAADAQLNQGTVNGGGAVDSKGPEERMRKATEAEKDIAKAVQKADEAAKHARELAEKARLAVSGGQAPPPLRY